MFFRRFIPGLLAAVMASGSAWAEPPENVPRSAQLPDRSLFDEATQGVTGLMDSGLQYLGIRYRFGGNNPESGFDCSGLVRRVFLDALGLNLPRTAREMSKLGQHVERPDLKPGDLVFFNTMRRTFSHVGIYMGDGRFLHSPSSGGRVRVEDMADGYWQKRFNGARRIAQPESVPTRSETATLN